MGNLHHRKTYLTANAVLRKKAILKNTWVEDFIIE